MKILVASLAAFLVALPIAAFAQPAQRPAAAPPKTPAPVTDVLATRRFKLAQPYVNTWSKDRDHVASGTLVVLKVDPAYVVPRDALEPVLYAGEVPVQRLNRGDRSGRVIGIVPGNVDLASAPIWFGPPFLPDHVTATTARAERARAEQAGLRPFAEARLKAVERAAVTAKDLAALLRDVAAPLVNEFSPQEKDLADSWRRSDAKGRRK
jgi:hypothetical protein